MRPRTRCQGSAREQNTNDDGDDIRHLFKNSSSHIYFIILLVFFHDAALNIKLYYSTCYFYLVSYLFTEIDRAIIIISNIIIIIILPGRRSLKHERKKPLRIRY